VSLQYLAGLFDGEGSVGLLKYLPKKCKRKNSIHVVYVTISNQCPLVLLELKKLYGGTFSKAVLNESHYGKKQVWQWRASSVIAETFLKEIFPFVIIKHEQIKYAIIARYFISRNLGLNNYYGKPIEMLEILDKIKIKISQLNHKNWMFQEIMGNGNNGE